MRKILIAGLVLALVGLLIVPVVSVANPIAESENLAPGELSISMLSLPTGPGGTPGPPPWAGGGDDDGNGEAANKWAVVVGIADYQGTANDLWNPDEDAKEMARSLKKHYGFPDANVRVLLNSDATAAEILAAIDWLAANETAESSVVFFFSGHGYRAPDAEGWDDDIEGDGQDEGIVTYDLYGLPDGQSTQYATLGNAFAQFETQKFALIFGSCHSGGMFDDDNSDLQAPGRVICSACRADQYGWDYRALRNTLFGYYFVDQGILKENADTDGDGVSMEEALAYAYPGVTAAQPDSQPQIYDGFAGELIP